MQIGVGGADSRGLGAADGSQQTRVLVRQEDQRLERRERAAERGNPREHDPRSGCGAADTLQRGPEIVAETARRRVVRGVVGTDDHGDDVRAGEKGMCLAGAQGLEGSRELRADEIRHPRAGPAIAHDVDIARLGIGDALGQQVGERVLRMLDADTDRRRVAEDRQAQPRTIHRALARMDDVIDPEAWPAGQELHAPQAHELHGDDSRERAGHRAEQPRNRDQPPVHADHGTADAGLTRIGTMPRVPLAPLVIVNPTAGGGRVMRSIGWLRERLAPRPEARLEITRHPGDAEALAADAVGSGHDRIVAIGGDGTVQEVINGMLAGGDGAELGIVPLGSGNDLARSLDLPSEPSSAWRVAIGRRTRRIDVGHAVNGAGAERWFASAGGVGFDAQVAAAMAQRRGWQAGRAGYLLTTLAELRRFENRPIEVTIDGEGMPRNVLFVAIANGAYYGGGMRIAPSARPDDGMLDICVVGDVSRLTVLRQLPNLYRGTHVDHPAVEMRGGIRVEIDGDRGTRIHLDGEPFGNLPLRVTLSHQVLAVAVPR